MSHFSVLVTKTQERDVESQLERFYEQGEDGDYFMKHQIEVAAEDVESEARHLLSDRIKNNGVLDKLVVKYQHSVDEGDFEAIVQDWNGGGWDDDGNLYYLSNPDAKWDWYQVGGRWTGTFKKKPGADGEVGEPSVFDNKPKEGYADIVKVGDIDWDGMKADALARANELWAAYEEDQKKPEAERKHPYLDFGIERDETKEHYLAKHGSFATFAVLHDDEWIERGSMGGWGAVSDEQVPVAWDKSFRKIIDSLDTEDEVTVVDCHI